MARDQLGAHTPRHDHVGSDILGLNKELRKFRVAIEKITDHIIITDGNAIVLYVNKAVEDTTGYKREEILNTKMGALWGGRMPKAFYKKLWRTIKQEKREFVGEIVNTRKNGEVYTSLYSITPILDESKADRPVIFFIALARDLTTRKESERKLKEYARHMAEGKARDDALLRSIGDGILVTDTAGRVMYANRAAEEIIGLPAVKLIGRELDEAVPFYDEAGRGIPKEERPLQRALLTKKEQELIYTDRTMYLVNQKTRKRIPLSINVSPYVVKNKAVGAVNVWRDITEGRAVVKAQNEFISFASHQMRTPLTSVRLSLDMLANPSEGPLTKEQAKYLHVALSATKEMTELIETLLNISRIQMGTLVVNPEPTDLPAFTNEVLRTMALAIDERKATVKKRYAKGVPAVTVDRRLMKIIIENLVSNALKYGPVSGSILIEIFKKGRQVVMAVSDTGIGIPKNQQEKVFEKLFRVELNNKVKGTGLGLYIVKAAVDQYGGKVWCESPSPRAFESKRRGLDQVGTTFYVTIPLSGMRQKPLSR